MKRPINIDKIEKMSGINERTENASKAYLDISNGLDDGPVPKLYHYSSISSTNRRTSWYEYWIIYDYFFCLHHHNDFTHDSDLRLACTISHPNSTPS